MMGPVVTRGQARHGDPAADAPPESRGLGRDGVRLMVATASTGSIEHTVFSRIGEHLRHGDLLVVNVSRTIPASLDGTTADGSPIRLHLSSPVAGSLWTVEPRLPAGVGSQRLTDATPGTVSFDGGLVADLLVSDSRSPRLWIAELRGVDDILDYLAIHGAPIRYSHVARPWPLEAYQTVYARVPGSVEMASAGRPFTAESITALVGSGVGIAPIVLHSGVASFEEGESPDAERFEVPSRTAHLINLTRSTGGRVIAVGTTSVRAVESAADVDGTVHPGSGVTDLIIGRDRPARVIDGLVTGWHDTGASHLDLVEGVAGPVVVEACYSEARERGYLWHEFGDSLLVTARD